MVDTPWRSPRRILICGDSNTWGLVNSPVTGSPERLSDAQRWPGILQAGLGDGFAVIVDALCGRLTRSDAQPAPSGEQRELEASVFDGLRHAPVAGASHSPLHGVIVMLGTNDLGITPARSVTEIAQGAADVAKAIVEGSRAIVPSVTPQVLLVAPAPLGGPREPHADLPGWLDAWDRSRRWHQTFAQVALENGYRFFDAGTVIDTDGADRVHLTVASHAALGRALTPVAQALAQG